jgi:sugar phosphate isomerase/epimerase
MTHGQGISRRSLLRSAAGAVAAAAVARGGAAADAPWRPTYILASALYGNFPLADILPEVAKTGAGSIDLWPKPHGTQREEIDTLGEDKVREMLAAAGVKLGSIACYTVGAFKLAGEFALAKRLGAEAPVLITMAPGKGNVPGNELAEAIEAFLENLRPSIAAAEESGGVIAIENHSSSLLQTPDGIRRFADAVTSDRVGVAFAPHHLPQDAHLIATLARDLGPRMKFVYAQQDGKGSKEKLPKEVELLQMPGRGPLDFGPLMRELAAQRFAGPVEIFMHPVPRGVPILDTVPAITAEVNRARAHLEKSVPGTESGKSG